MAKYCGMIPVSGTIAVVGPVELAPYDTIYHNIVIRDESGTLRDFATVHAIPELSGLIQPNASGTFLFLNSLDGCRLCFVYSHTGPRAVDFEAVHEYLEQSA